MRALELLNKAGDAGKHARVIAALGFALCGLIALVAAVGVEGRRLNLAALHAEEEALSGALARQLQEQLRDLGRIASVSGSSQPLANLSGPSSFARLFWLEASGDPAPSRQSEERMARQIVARLQDNLWDRVSRADETGAIDELNPTQPAPADTRGFVAIEGQLYAAAIAPVKAISGSLIGLRQIDQNYLAHLSSISKVRDLQVSERADPASGRAALPVAASEEWVGQEKSGAAVALSWQPQRPGDLLILGYGVWLLGLTIVVAAALIWQAHRAVGKLRESEAQTRRLAGFDPLTGLPNRFIFSQFIDSELARSERGGGSFAYLALDIDRLKEVNDSFGQEVGDRLIVAIAGRISGVLRVGDRLGRMDGDEFAVLQTEVAGASDCADLAARIFEALKEPIDLGETCVAARLSIGVALHPDDASTREDLMQCADQALSRAKDEGRNRYAFFEKEIGDRLRARRVTEAELRDAIHSGGLRVLYQPIVTADGARISCVEALVRWSHPKKGLVPPDHFIALAEDRGLILELGAFVLRQACKDGRDWPGLRVAVNVSPVQFRQNDFAQIVEKILDEEGFPPSQLELELTEGVVIADADQAENVMMDLRSLGVRLALDDFGTGYSSLVYLRRFAFDKIKIDRSFLESMEATGESAIIVHSIIHLGRALGLTVTAEGIETAEQHRFLQAAGAHELQGYLFSKPVEAAEITRMINRGCARATA